jgi:diacylglycerol kinase family enzyme
MAPAMYTGRHDRKTDRLKFMHCREIEIHTSRPLSINTDGEALTRTPARFQVIPAAITVLAPRQEPPFS